MRERRLHALAACALLLALAQACVVYKDYRDAPSPAERGRYAWLAQRYGGNVLHQYLNTPPSKQQGYLLFVLKADPEGKKCLDAQGELDFVRGAPAHCIPLWFPEGPSWTGEARSRGAAMEISEFARRDRVWYLAVEKRTGLVVAQRSFRWKTPLPSYWSVYRLEQGAAPTLEAARQERRRELQGFRAAVRANPLASE